MFSEMGVKDQVFYILNFSNIRPLETHTLEISTPGVVLNGENVRGYFMEIFVKFKPLKIRIFLHLLQ